MKRFLTITSALVLGVFAVISSGCGSNNGTKVYPNTMTATVKGVVTFSATGNYAYASKTNGTVNMVATTTSNTRITISIPSFNAVAGTTLPINHIGVPAGASYDSVSNGAVHLASYGTVTFTSVTPYLQGTFSFTCADSTKISSGSFKIKAP